MIIMITTCITNESLLLADHEKVSVQHIKCAYVNLFRTLEIIPIPGYHTISIIVRKVRRFVFSDNYGLI